MNRKKKFTFEGCNNYEMESAFEEILSLSPSERPRTEVCGENYSRTRTTSRYRSLVTSKTSDYEEMSVEHESFEETVVDEDDEVFLDTEQSNGIAIVERRERRCSDVVDMIPSLSPIVTHEGSHAMSIPGRRFSSVHSPPGTPGSDGGYSSTALYSPQPTDLPFVRTRWERMSGPEIRTRYVPSSGSRRVNESVDANPMQASSEPNKPSICPIPVATMPVSKDSFEYNMNHKYRGPAIIFNNISFSSEEERKGSDIDTERLKQVFKVLGFDVELHTDFKLKDLMDVVSEFSLKDYSECDCFAIIILTHGLNGDLLLTKEGIYQFQDIWSCFTPDRCPSLAGKPKLFFVQACRGQSLDRGIQLVSNRRDPRSTQTDSACEAYKIPTMSDFLFGRSSYDGFFSFRNPEKGSWYIQSLCDVLEEFHLTTDLMSMMTIVNRKVSSDYESYNNVTWYLHEIKQTPTVVHTLMRNVFFKPKPALEAGPQKETS